MFVRMTQGYVWALRKVGYRAPQPKSPIGIRSGISDYVGPGSTPKFFSSTGLLCSSLAIPNMYGLCPFFCGGGFMLFRTGRTATPILTVHGSKDAFWCKEMAFGG